MFVNLCAFRMICDQLFPILWMNITWESIFKSMRIDWLHRILKFSLNDNRCLFPFLWRWKKRPLLSKYCLKIEKHPEPLSVVQNVKESISANKTNNLPRSSKQKKTISQQQQCQQSKQSAASFLSRCLSDLFSFILFFARNGEYRMRTEREEQTECTLAQWKDLI